MDGPTKQEILCVCYVIGERSVWQWQYDCIKLRNIHAELIMNETTKIYPNWGGNPVI